MMKSKANVLTEGSTMDITVVIPTFNAAPFIAETIDSVICQTLPPSQIIVVDDASTDNTYEIVTNFVKHSSVPIRFVQRNCGSGGPAAPLNAGMSLVASKWVALLDHDDLMLSNKLERQSAAIIKHNSNFCFSDYKMLGPDGTLTSGLSPEQRRMLIASREKNDDEYPIDKSTYLQSQALEPGIIQSCSNLFFHIELFHRHGPFDEKRSAIADYAFKLAIVDHVQPVFIDTVLFHKRWHQTNLYKVSDDRELRRDVRRLALSSLQRRPAFLRNDFIFRQKLCAQLCENGYRCRCRGLLRESMEIYIDAVATVGLSMKLLMHLVKWPAAVFRDTILKKTFKYNSVRSARCAASK